MENEVDNSLSALTHPYRETTNPNCYQDFVMNGMRDLQIPNLNCKYYVKALTAVQNDCFLDPKTIEEALNGVDGNHWKDSISQIIWDYIKNKTQEIVNEP